MFHQIRNALSRVHDFGDVEKYIPGDWESRISQLSDPRYLDDLLRKYNKHTESFIDQWRERRTLERGNGLRSKFGL